MYIGQGQNETPGVKSSAVTLGAWAELRTQIESNLFFAYGVGSYVVNGVSAGSDLQTFGISPFVSFEYYATPHFMLSTWSNIFDYSTTNLGAKTGMPAMTFSKSAMFQSYAAVTYFF
jgi:hypothetical protein